MGGCRTESPQVERDEEKTQGRDWVGVRSKEEILHSLDASGKLDGTPFMPENVEVLWEKVQVYKRAQRPATIRPRIRTTRAGSQKRSLTRAVTEGPMPVVRRRACFTGNWHGWPVSEDLRSCRVGHRDGLSKDTRKRHRLMPPIPTLGS